MGSLNAIPIVGWFISLLVAMSLAVPFWFVWSCLGIGATFFNFLPAVWLTIGFWQTVGVFTCVSILKLVVFPRSVVNNSNKAVSL